jgi:hypothetical protein
LPRRSGRGRRVPIGVVFEALLPGVVAFDADSCGALFFPHSDDAEAVSWSQRFIRSLSAGVAFGGADVAVGKVAEKSYALYRECAGQAALE